MPTNIKLLFTHLNSKCQNDSRNKNKMKRSLCHCCYSQGRREWPRAATDVSKDTSPPIVKISRFTHNYSTELRYPSSLQFGSSISWRIKRRERVTSTSTSRTQSLTIGHAIFNNLRKVPFFHLIFEISILESCIISLSFNSRSFLIVEDCVPNCQRLSKIAFPIAKD